MYIAVKDNNLIFGKDLDRLLEQADPGSDHVEVDENELQPSFYLVNGKILDGRNEEDSNVVKAYDDAFAILEKLKQIDITVAPRPAREFIINCFNEKFTEEEMRDKVWLSRIFEGEARAVELRNELAETKAVILARTGAA